MLEGLQLHLALRRLRAFVIEDLSHWYIRLVRRRFWQEKQNKDKLASYAALHYALKTWLVLSSPFIPLLTETVYQQAFRKTGKSGHARRLIFTTETVRTRQKNNNTQREGTITNVYPSSTSEQQQLVSST